MADELAVMHLSERTLRELIGDRLTVPRTRRSVLHLSRCRRCRARMHGLQGGPELLAEIFGPDDREHAELPAREAAELLLAHQLVRDLEKGDPASWPLLARHDRRFEPLAAVAALLNVAEQEFYSDLEVADGASAAAVAALEEWQLKREPTDRARALGVRAWAVRATVLRMTSRLREAEAALAKARSLKEGLPFLPTLERFLAVMAGGVHRDCGRYAAAIAEYQRAIALAVGTRDRVSIGRCMSLVAFCFSDRGEPAKAAALLEALRPELQAIPYPHRLRMAVIGNLATAYTRLGRTLDARRLLPDLEKLAAEAGEPLSTVRISWIRGMIHHQDGHAAKAEHFYREVQAAFLKAGVPQDVALVSLDLAVLFLEHDQPARAAEVAGELIPVFGDLGLTKETLASGLVVLRALERQQATVDAVRELAKKLQRSAGWAG